MLVKLAKRLYFKPRRCPDCGKICLFCKHHLSERCKDCHEQRWKKIHRKNHKLARKKRGIQIGDSARKRRINQVGYCQLCGCTENLTYHHVGGGAEHYTILCRDCHENYETFNNKRESGKDKKWRLMSCVFWRSQTMQKS